MPKASRDTSPRTLARNMKRLFAIAAACCLLLSTLAVGEGFQATEYQISVEAPSGWEHDDKDHFGFVICDPQSQNKKRKFRIHFPSGGASTPKEQVELSLNTINKRREGKYPLERIQYEKPVTTRTGVEGYMAAHGFEVKQTAHTSTITISRFPPAGLFAFVSISQEQIKKRKKNWRILSSIRYKFFHKKGKTANGAEPLIPMPLVPKQVMIGHCGPSETK